MNCFYQISKINWFGRSWIFVPTFLLQTNGIHIYFDGKKILLNYVELYLFNFYFKDEYILLPHGNHNVIFIKALFLVDDVSTLYLNI